MEIEKPEQLHGAVRYLAERIAVLEEHERQLSKHNRELCEKLEMTGKAELISLNAERRK